MRVGIGFLVGARRTLQRVCCLGILDAQPTTRLPDAVVVFAEDAGRGHAETYGESDGEEECFGAGLHAGAPVVLVLAGGKGVWALRAKREVGMLWSLTVVVPG